MMLHAQGGQVVRTQDAATSAGNGPFTFDHAVGAEDMEGVAPWGFVTKCLRTFAALQP